VNRPIRDWVAFWELSRNPFSDQDRTFVETPHHQSVMTRLAAAIEAQERSVLLIAEPGAGKTRLLQRALSQVARPCRKQVSIVAPADGLTFVRMLAERFGARRPDPSSWSSCWKALGDALRVRRSLGDHVVLAIDDAHVLPWRDVWPQLHSLSSLGCRGGFTLIWSGRVMDDPEEPWSSDYRRLNLGPLSYSEAAHYVTEKLGGAGRWEPVFTNRALTRLHAWSHGVPGCLNRLAMLSLEAGADRGLERLSSELIDEVALVDLDVTMSP
jgi:general secretion pathway protein A